MAVSAKWHAGSDVAVKFFTYNELSGDVDCVGLECGTGYNLEGAVSYENLFHLLVHCGMDLVWW